MDPTRTDEAVLDRAPWASLVGAHAHLAEARGRARRYRPDVSPFAALEDPADPGAWADLAALVGPGGSVALPGVDEPGPGWEVERRFDVVQMVAGDVAAAGATHAVLGDADVPAMLELTARTRPGPFLPATNAMGTYLGVRDGGALVAMAGERLRPPGWTEISAVCTDPSARGRGLAGALVRELVGRARARGDASLLHVLGTNAGALGLYEHLGFRVRGRITILDCRVTAA